MENIEKTRIQIEITIDQPVEKVWEIFTKPEHITHWNYASETWHCPSARNDLKTGGTFLWRMEAKDGSAGFDFTGAYENIIPSEMIRYQLADGRKVQVEFHRVDDKTRIIQVFEADGKSRIEQQKSGWQSILDNLKSYAEG